MTSRLYTRAGDDLLIIEENSDGVFLHIVRKSGMWSDSWHQSIDDAKKQAQHEFKGLQNIWNVATDDHSTLKDFAKKISS
ncbi:MAG TPA: hypothetical protein VG309_03910 [Rhizomicrobium sp.]|nr:hypothetical protein [Rhizomicrobium sp.]